LRAALALVQAFPEKKLQIKWPNDLLLRGLKCGGILSEASTQGKDTYVCLGIGLNVESTPEGILSSALDLDWQEALAKLLESLQKHFPEDAEDWPGSMEEVLEVYQDHQVFWPKRKLSWFENNENKHGVFLGFDLSGAVEVSAADPKMSRRVLRAEEVHLETPGTVQPLWEEELHRYCKMDLEHMREPSAEPFHPHLSLKHFEDIPARRLELAEALSRPLRESGWVRLWGAWLDGSLVGGLSIQGAGLESSRHRAHLGLGLLSSARGKGLGFGLLQSAIEWARGVSGLRYLDLHVLSTNTQAIQLYEKAGFRKEGIREDAFRIAGKRIDDVRMVLDLRGAL
jgi:biotin-(acetyl-CoA carboxylase) ligase/ribosomal protein S18 acetylase RimI-like enzyme